MQRDQVDLTPEDDGPVAPDAAGQTPVVAPVVVPPVIAPPAQGAPPVLGDRHDVVRPPRFLPPRVWTVFVAVAVMIPAQLLLAFVAGVVFVLRQMAAGAPLDPITMVERLTATTDGLAVMIIAAETPLLVGSVLAGVLSPQPIARRLGLQRSRLAWYVWPVPMLGMLATMAIGVSLVEGLMALLNLDREEMLGPFRAMLSGQWAAILLLMAVVPAVCEELFFRGYLQRRLLERWHPAAAIAITSGLFAAIHLHPVQVMAVFLSGAWMSIVAWRTGSIWLSVGCHMFLNASAIALSRSIDDFFSGIGLAVLLGCLVTGVLAMIASCLLFSRIEPGPRRVLPRRPVLMPADRPPLSG